ncbi:deoxyribose-phosphate aldolase [[Synechococcus] sp. NIES-970]|uniref:deoxyribose-phosphate aldolase n=1 Tax=Picosynechococcus sp. NKBG15041c TaxID=1407650 RepID=UPI0004104819|nr:deoxyribose-phosphate aldolase [Picosynechococcus sp. NKBG15041c]BAW95832.1 deoxyribose-phosphate aldolase [[Synechococcus] sp. NIES-970]
MVIPANEIDLAQYLEHSLLHPAATYEQVKECCQVAEQFNFPAVCLYPTAMRTARDFLKQRSIQLCCVVGFPAGAHTIGTKLYEAQEAVENGATELDLMLNLALLKMGDSEKLYQEVAQIVEMTKVPIKAILETALLTDTEKRLAAEVCLDAGASYLKTSTGWFGGATTADVKLLYGITKGKIGIKAAGGIKTADQAIALIQAGANRLGTSRSLSIIQERERQSDDEAW